ncbi:hypothetical protein AAH172_21920 [Bacteroides xylanisolvens]|jgi:hypothetical protein|uniref:hypothetical protein n=1 Tax=Bacteroides xylanisolvens TaxID=371601 RepID=UPI0039B44F32
MDGKEIFNEILKSPKLKEMLNVSADSNIEETFDGNPQNKEVAIIRHIIEGQLRHTSDDNIFKNITKLFDL